MNVKDFLYNEGLDDIHNIFLFYNFAHFSTTLTSIRKGAYRESDFKFDCKQNYLLKFPAIKDYEFEELWKNTINKFKRFDIDYYEEMGFNEADIIFKIGKTQIINFITKKIENLDRNEIKLLEEFLKSGSDNTKDYNIAYNDKNGDFLISLGLLYKGAYYNSNGDLEKTDYYYYPRYFSDLKYDLIKYIEDRNYYIIKSKKERKIKTKKAKKVLDSEEEIYKLKVIFKGKKGKKKIKFGISEFKLGAEFIGQDQETLEIKCGNCGMSDKFIIQDQKERLLRCGKCGKLNKPFGKDEFYFE